jgi:hypothetical protein
MTTKQLEINDIDDLIELIESGVLTPERVCTLIQNCINVITFAEPDHKKRANELKEFWNKYKDSQERPIFLFGDDMDFCLD